MQNVVLGAYAFKLTGSAAFVGLVYFAQLGPLLFLSTLGGLLADVVDRRRFLVARSSRSSGSRSRSRESRSRTSVARAIVVCVFAVGIANALGAPGSTRSCRRWCPREDLPGAVALASVQMNLSR